MRLGEIAPAKSGIPTRVVGYFCLEEVTDATITARMGLRSQRDRQRLTVVRDGRGALHVLEREALKPMVRRPGVLDGRIDVESEDTDPWRMLYLTDSKSELELKRWAHVLTYIHYGETTDFPAKEGSRRAGGIPALRPQVRVRPVWFQVPRIPTGQGRVCWLKGRGDRHYAPTLAADILIPDNFLYSAPPAELSVPRAFAAVANLTWTNLMAEVYGRRGGGDGVLHTYVRELAQLPIINPLRFTRAQAEDMVELFNRVSSRSALPIDDELRQPDRQAFDSWAMKYLFGEDSDDAARAVERAIRDLAMERTQRTISGREQQQKAVRRTVFDPAPIAARILMDHGIPPRLRDFLPSEESWTGMITTMDVPAHESAPATLGETLLDQGDVLIGQNKLMETPSEAHSRAVVALLAVDPKFTGEFALPVDSDVVSAAVDEWSAAWGTWRQTVRAALKTVLPKPSQAQRRVQVARELESRTGLLAATLASD
ncbi:hypothetical protein [Streptomyces sp. YPW6]|uniref:hypothetical protein n=1 Tax=Streptomyces sp. YPW6 TaxID=2840373 RepID=UPI003D71AA08